MRKRLYNIIEVAKEEDRASAIYDWAMIALIILSLIPLTFKRDTAFLRTVDKVCVIVFILDYLFRWMTADLKLRKGKLSFLIYPVSFMAIVDLLSILPSLSIVRAGLRAFAGFRILRVMRMIRAFRVFRVFKAFRYSKSIRIIAHVLKNSRDSLVAVGIFAAGYIVVAALIIFNVEPESFGSFFDAVYWACVSLTTVGYGDIYAVSTLGRIVTMISSIFGIAIVALPAGIITAGYMKTIDEESQKS